MYYMCECPHGCASVCVLCKTALIFFPCANYQQMLLYLSFLVNVCVCLYVCARRL